MTKNKQDLREYKATVTSQWGEDGVLGEIFRRIGTTNKYCIEFGAWDAKHYSNVWTLWHDQGWSGLLIEGDKKRCKDLFAAIEGFPKVKGLAAFVAIQGENSLEQIMARMGTPKELDLLCIDIDSDDYHIFDSVKSYAPRCVVVEFNPTIPPEIDFIQPQGGYFGSSAKSMLSLAHSKGYRMATMTETNMFLVRESEFAKLKIEEPTVMDIFPRHLLSYVVSAYNGSVFITRKPNYMRKIRKSRVLNVLRSSSPHPKIKETGDWIPIVLNLPGKRIL